jgi:bacterial/archaeal transporter family-2 protein
MIIFLVLLAILIGSLMPLQAAINSELSRLIQNPFMGGFISFAFGTLTLGIILLTKGLPVEEFKRLSHASPHLFIGGVLGALFVGSSIFLIPKLGATTMIGAFVTGQLLMSLAVDHFGLFGVPAVAISMTRILGVFLLFAGLLLVVRKVA